MKVAILNAFDIEGGAARAAYRLHQGLRGMGVVSQMLVQKKESGEATILTSKNRLAKEFDKFKGTLNNLPLQLYRQRQRIIFSPQWLPDSIPSQIAQLSPDIINLHWVCSGYLQIETLPKLNQPIVWTLHDMWAFTGGCHYSQDCQKYQAACGSCPQLSSRKDQDLSRWIWQRKAKAWPGVNLTLVTPSRWLADCAKSSSLFQNFRVEVIANGLDIQKYKPINRQVARELLNLPQDKQLLLFGAVDATSDRRKGFHLLQPALQSLSQTEWKEKLELVIFGASEPETPVNLGFKAHYLGYLHDDVSLALLYSAVNLTVVPSIQEAFGQTASESLACGTPVVCFDCTGLKDIVEHEQNGYRAQCFQSEDLVKGITWILEDQERWQRLCQRAREKVEQEFTLQIQAHNYLKLFEELL